MILKYFICIYLILQIVSVNESKKTLENKSIVHEGAVKPGIIFGDFLIQLAIIRELIKKNNMKNGSLRQPKQMRDTTKNATSKLLKSTVS